MRLRRTLAPKSTLAALAVIVVLGSLTTGSGTGAAAVARQLAQATLVGRPAPAGATTLLGVSCGSPRRCWAVGSGSRETSETAADQHDIVDSTSNGGASWSEQVLPIATPSALSSISCADASNCMAVGDQLTTTLVGTVLVTSDAGRRWSMAATPPGAVDVVGVSCSTSLRCLVLVTDGSSFWAATTVDGGETWLRGGTLPSGFAGASSVDCPDAGSCVVAGYLPAAPGHGTGTVAYSDDGGTTWQASTLPAGIGLLHHVSCPTLQTCVAVGTLSTTDSDVAPGKSALLISTDGAKSFTVLRSPPSIDDAFGVSCTLARRCVAVGTAWAPRVPRRRSLGWPPPSTAGPAGTRARSSSSRSGWRP